MAASHCKKMHPLNQGQPSIPLVDKNIFNGRPECMVKDGVWIKVGSKPSQPRAVQDAIVEQQKIDKIVEDKEARLKQFQRDVQRRVTQITRAQRQMDTQAQTENMKEEQEILYRSVAAAENLTPKKNRCTYNVNQITIDASGKLTAHYKHEQPREHATSTLLRQSCEIERLHRKARQNLAQRCLVRPSQDDSSQDGENAPLPGGLWGISASRDKSAARILLSSKSGNHVTETNEDDGPQTITASSAPHDIAIATVQEGIASSPVIKSKLRKDTDLIVSDLPTALSLDEDVEDECGGMESQENQDPAPEYCSAPASALAPSSVYFKSGVEGEWKRQEVIPCESPPPKQVAITRLGKNMHREKDVTIKSHRCHSAAHKKSEFPVATPGVVEHERKKMDERSRLLSRRVFSDMEREKVREERRRREHKCKVERLRAVKEAERQQLENEHDNKVHAAEAKLKRQRIAKEMKEKRKIKREQDKADKQKRTERFATALKAQIREKLEINQITLPPLCCCSTSFWGTNPYTCANNCIFYRNMEAYTAALQSVLSTVERGTALYKHDKTLDHSVVSLLVTNDY